MKIYYLIDTDSGWDNVVSMALSPQKCIEGYTDKEVILETEQEAYDWAKNKNLVIEYKYIYE